MRFWDSSAIVALLVEQNGSAEARRLAEEDRAILAWWGTFVECEAALSRMVRTGELARAEVPRVRAELVRFRADWGEIEPTPEIREGAVALVRRHPLSAADALQLAAATFWRVEASLAYPFVTLDRRLYDAAAAEGFQVLPEL